MCLWPMSVMTGDDGWGHALSQVPSGNVHSIHIVEDISLIGRFIDIMSSLTDIFPEIFQQIVLPFVRCQN